MTADIQPLAIAPYCAADFLDLLSIAPGIYTGVPDETYHAIPLPSFHRIAPLVYDGASLGHYRGTISDPEADWEDDSTTAMKVGRALHLAVFQPDVYKATVIDGPVNPKTNQGYGMDTKAFAACEAENPGCYVLPPGKVRTNIEAMAEEVLQHPRMVECMTGNCLMEATVIVDAPTSLTSSMRMKCRPDLWDLDTDMILDLKKCQCAANGAFSRKDIGNYNYDGQAALYRELSGVAGRPIDGFVFCAVEEAANVWTPSGRRHGIMFHDLDQLSMDAAWNHMEPHLVGLHTAIEADEWPGYSQDLEPISSPAWKRGGNKAMWD